MCLLHSHLKHHTFNLCCCRGHVSTWSLGISLGQHGTAALSGRALSIEWAQTPPLIPTHCWELQKVDGASQRLARGCQCALPCSFLASVPYAQFKLGVFRSVSLELSGTIQSFWSCSHVYFCRLRCLARIPNSKQNFAGGVNCQFCQTWHILLWEIHYLLESILKIFLNILFLSRMHLL